MDDEADQSPHRVYEPENGADPDNAGVADGDAVPSAGHRGSSDADEQSPGSESEQTSAD